MLSNALQQDALQTLASASGWPCTALLLSAQCAGSQTQTLSVCGPSAPQPPSLPPPPPSTASCAMRLVVNSLTATNQTAEQAAALCASLAIDFTAELPPADLLSPFGCVAPTQYKRNMWSLTMFATAASTPAAQQVLALTQQQALLASLAAASGWSCSSMQLSAQCTGPTQSLTVCAPPPPAAPSQPPPGGSSLGEACVLTLLVSVNQPLLEAPVQVLADCQRGAAAANVGLLAGLQGSTMETPFRYR